jgi:hypothetical protein
VFHSHTKCGTSIFLLLLVGGLFSFFFSYIYIYIYISHVCLFVTTKTILFISTLLDPLHFDTGDFDTNWDLYLKVCKGRTKDFAKQKLVDIAQERQETWFGKWVAQMTRIAKPGAPVIIESIALPLCDEMNDWDGVTKEWWNVSIQTNRYGWDIDPTSLVYGNDLNSPGRYHVAMRRRRR